MSLAEAVTVSESSITDRFFRTGSQKVGERLTAFQQWLMEHASATKDQKVKDVEADRGRFGAVMLEHIERDLSLGIYRHNLAVDKRASRQ